MLNQDQYRQDWQGNKSVCDYVVSSGETHTIREFIELAFDSADIDGEWKNDTQDPTQEQYVGSDGEVLVKINKKFFRPAEVELLLGSHDKIKQELGWAPKNSFSDLVKKMVLHDVFLLESAPF